MLEKSARAVSCNQCLCFSLSSLSLFFQYSLGFKVNINWRLAACVDHTDIYLGYNAQLLYLLDSPSKRTYVHRLELSLRRIKSQQISIDSRPEKIIRREVLDEAKTQKPSGSGQLLTINRVTTINYRVKRERKKKEKSSIVSLALAFGWKS